MIRELTGNNAKWALNIIKSHEDYYGKVSDINLIHANFYQVESEKGNLVGFFALCYFEQEMIIASIYIKKHYRRRGYFNEIIQFSRLKYIGNNKIQYLVVNAQVNNKLANDIYAKKFTYHHTDKKEQCCWYIIEERWSKNI